MEFNTSKGSKIDLRNIVEGKRRGRVREGQEAGWRAEEVDVRTLKIDSYQRNIKQPHLRRIVRTIREEGWNPLKFGVIQISKREDGSCFVIDGQHRIKAVLELDGLVPFIVKANVWYGLTRTEEAYMFSETQSAKSRAAIVPADTHNAHLYMDADSTESKRAWEIENVLQRYGYFISSTVAPEDSRRINAVQAVYDIEDRYGIDMVESVFSLITHTWGNELAPESGVIWGFAQFIAVFPDAKFSGLPKHLRKKQMKYWIEDAYRTGDARKIKSRRNHVYYALHDTYNRAFHQNPLPDATAALKAHQSDIHLVAVTKSNKSRSGGK